MQKLDISVIVPVFNRARELQQCLTAILRNEPGAAEVIVVDDGSTDDSAAVAKHLGARVIRGAHQGASRARNLGATKASHDTLVFIDSDVEIRQRDLVNLATPVLDGQVCGAFAVLDPDMKTTSILGDFHNLSQHYAFALLPGKSRTCHTSFIAIKKTDFLNSGAFDAEWKKAVVDDVILGWRLLQSGCELECRDDIRVRHHKSYSPRGFVRSRFLYGFEWLRATRKYGNTAQSDAFSKKDMVNSIRMPVNVLLSTGMAASSALGPFGALPAALCGGGFLAWNRGFFKLVKDKRGNAAVPLNGLFLIVESLCVSAGLGTGLIAHPLARLF